MADTKKGADLEKENEELKIKIEELEEQVQHYQDTIKTLVKENQNSDKASGIVGDRVVPVLTWEDEKYQILLSNLNVKGRIIAAKDLAENPENYKKEISFLLSISTEILKKV